MTNQTWQNKTVKILDELLLVGFRVLCSGDQYTNEISKTSLRLNTRMSEIKHVINPSQQVGAFVVENSSDDEDGYWICFEVSKYEDIPNDMVTLTIPSQKYAVLRHRGSNVEIMNAYQDLHLWMKENNYRRQKEKWHIERFYNWIDPKNVDVELFDTIH
ncbi:GyrI-like domain-containing protein [Heyndrickxia vini]|uniref:GyrI-like domain-containing protein n=1 Tax=Heyndrickxia vini TaxID=1476025 RepID=A0ABX7E3S9_9BACI|nr:GyrI-like domain-containing protein [Heyndrickxia vini]QQZ09910.1 GyrI-like domain-containing protein [Heyndrickxia vini]